MHRSLITPRSNFNIETGKKIKSKSRIQLNFGSQKDKIETTIVPYMINKEEKLGCYILHVRLFAVEKSLDTEEELNERPRFMKIQD